MAARQRYPAVHDQLRELALAARAEGLAFEAFWLRAVRPGLPPVTWRTPAPARPAGCVVWPNDTFDRRCVMDATLDAVTESAWRAAYLRVPATRRESALRLLAPVLERAAAEGDPLVAA